MNFTNILDRIKTNDCSLNTLDFSKYAFTVDELKLLKDSLVTNNVVCNVHWGALPENRAVEKLVTDINRKLFTNLANFKLFPSDYIYGLLSLHAYEESNVEEKPILTKVEYTNHLRDWSVKQIFHNQTNGYHAVLYQNSKSCQTVLANRGTNPEGLLNELIIHKDVAADINGVALEKMITPLHDVYKAVSESVQSSKEEGYHLSFTGHSLGAWQAEMAVYFAFRDFNYKNSRAVTFDSPGSLDFFEALRPNIQNVWTEFNHGRLDIKTYLSIPNLINSCNRHIGQVYSVRPKVTISELQQAKEFWEQTLFRNTGLVSVDYVISLLTATGHSLESIMSEFNSETGVPSSYKQALDWPCMSCNYRDGSDHIAGMVDKWFGRVIGTTFKLFFPRALKDLPSYKLANIMVDLVEGKISLTQYLSTISNQVVPEIDLAVIQDMEKKFYLKYEGHYSSQEPNLYLEPFKGIEKTPEWYMKELKIHAKFFEYRYKNCGLNEVEGRTIYNLNMAVEFSIYQEEFTEAAGIFNSTNIGLPLDYLKQKVMKLMELSGEKIRYCIEIFSRSLYQFEKIMEEEEGGAVFELTEEYIKNGGEIERVDSNGDTLLHYAVLNNHAKAATLLANNGASVSVNNNQGKSPIDIAIQNSAEDIIAALKQYMHLPNTSYHAKVILDKYGIYSGGGHPIIFQPLSNFEGQSGGFKLAIQDFDLELDKLDLSSFNVYSSHALQIESIYFAGFDSCLLKEKSSERNIVILMGFDHCNNVLEQVILVGEDNAEL